MDNALVVGRYITNITLGGHLFTSAAELERALDDAHYIVSDWGKHLLEVTTVSAEQISLSLHGVKLPDLGFSQRFVDRDKVFERAAELGLMPLPAEAAVLFRLGYYNQPHGEKLVMAMEPKCGRRVGHLIFVVQRSGTFFYLDARAPSAYVTDQEQLVFARAI